MTDDVLEVMAQHENVCKYIHLPVQSGNSDVLKRMNRGYTREWYLERMESIHRIMPDCATSTDIISGFCGETEAEHQDTLSLMEMMRYDMAYMFSYSERPRTLAQRKYENDVPEEVKKRRLQEIMAVQKVHAANRTKSYVGRTYRVLVEGTSKKKEDQFFGRTTYNTVVVFPKEEAQPGTYVNVHVHDCTPVTLIGTITPDSEDA
jgi:tRNA-2-methylthio-N6-dimethylallyladenosine synthase